MRRFNVFGQGVRVAFEDDTTPETNPSPAPKTDDTSIDEGTGTSTDDPKPAGTDETPAPAEPSTTIEPTDPVEPAATPAPEEDKMVLPVGVELVVAHNEDKAALEAAVNEIVELDGDAILFDSAMREVHAMRTYVEEAPGVMTNAERALVEVRATEIAQNLSIPPVEVAALSTEDEAVNLANQNRLASHLADMESVLRESGERATEYLLRSIYNTAELRLDSLKESEFTLKGVARTLRSSNTQEKTFSPGSFAEMAKLIVSPNVEALANGKQISIIPDVRNSSEVLTTFAGYLSTLRHLVNALTVAAKQLVVVMSSRDEREFLDATEKAVSLFTIATSAAFSGAPRGEDKFCYLYSFANPTALSMLEDAAAAPRIVSIPDTQVKIEEPVKVSVLDLSDSFYAASTAVGAFRSELNASACTELKARLETAIEMLTSTDSQAARELIASNDTARAAFDNFISRVKNTAIFLLCLNAQYVGSLTNLALFAQRVVGEPEQQPVLNPEA